VASSAILVALVVMVIGGYVGWHLRHASGAASDLRVHKTRIPNFRKTRNRSWVISLLVIGITLLILRAMMK
jgi:TRAP-type C4-dicarboxylate transport system permease small subunit